MGNVNLLPDLRCDQGHWCGTHTRPGEEDAYQQVGQGRSVIAGKLKTEDLTFYRLLAYERGRVQRKTVGESDFATT